MGYKRRTAMMYKADFIFDVDLTVRGMSWPKMNRKKVVDVLEGFFSPIRLEYRLRLPDGYPSPAYVSRASAIHSVKPSETSKDGKITAVSVMATCSGTVKTSIQPDDNFSKLIIVLPHDTNTSNLGPDTLYVAQCKLLSISTPAVSYLNRRSFSMRWALPPQKLEDQVLSVLKSLASKSEYGLFSSKSVDQFVNMHVRDIARRVWELHNYNRHLTWAPEHEIREAAGYILLNKP